MKKSKTKMALSLVLCLVLMLMPLSVPVAASGLLASNATITDVYFDIAAGRVRVIGTTDPGTTYTLALRPVGVPGATEIAFNPVTGGGAFNVTAPTTGLPTDFLGSQYEAVLRRVFPVAPYEVVSSPFAVLPPMISPLGTLPNGEVGVYFGTHPLNAGPGQGFSPPAIQGQRHRHHRWFTCDGGQNHTQRASAYRS